MPGTPWWHHTVVYQIYPRSFLDTNGDGIGDLAGIIAKLDYLQDLGVETLWLSPFFRSPQADFGYDISDFRDVAPEYGDLATCEALIEAAHARGLKVVLDLVLNHTSDQHPWFLESRSSRDNPKRDWYIWREGQQPHGAAPPNNWFNMIGSRGWHYDDTTGEWYWAQFLPCQPDLNYRNPAVRAEMLDTIRFWMDTGVDGFRLDIINALFEDRAFRDNPFAWKLFPSHDDPSMLFRSTEHTLNHPDTLEFMRELRQLIDTHDSRERFMVGEVIASVESARRFCGDNEDGLHLVFLFPSLTVPLEAEALRTLIARYETLFPAPLLPTWVFSNHDRTRRISRLHGHLEQAKLNAALQLTLRGIPFIYNGEEVGIEQHHLPARTALDPIAHQFRHFPQCLIDGITGLIGETLNRDECRTPMQWNATDNAGFCEANVTPWLPVTPSYPSRNVATQQRDPDSLWHCYRRFLYARRTTPALHSGDLTLLHDAEWPPSVLAYRRCITDTENPQEVVVYLNCAGARVQLPRPPHTFQLLVSTIDTHTTRHRHDTTTMTLSPWEGSVFIDTAGGVHHAFPSSRSTL